MCNIAFDYLKHLRQQIGANCAQHGAIRAISKFFSAVEPP